MQNILLVPMTIADFKRLIKECIQEYGESHLRIPQEAKDKQFSQKEAAKYLNVSQATLIDWKKKKLVPYHQVPGTNRVFFLKSELLFATQQNENLLKPAKN